MRWHDMATWEKAAVLIVGFWFTAGWLIAFAFPNPKQVWDAPFIIVGFALSALWVLATVFAWVLRKLGH
jgi:hypothetical protein